MGNPYEFTSYLLVLCLSDSSQWGSEVWGAQNDARGKDCLGTSVPVC